MEQRINRLLYWTPVAAAAAIAVAIVILSLVAIGAFNLPFAKSEEPGVIQNYVLFTHIEAGTFTVTTGVGYVSTIDMRVDSQWCYVQRSAGPMDRSAVTIATASAIGAVSYDIPSADTLDFLGLDAAAVRALADRYCHFIQ